MMPLKGSGPVDECSLRPKAIYTAADLAGVGHLDSLPGQVPFVRGPHHSMYVGRPWTIRQYSGYADAVTSNLAYRRALAQGAQGLSIAFDLPTHRGYDSDHPLAQADVGMAGVAIDSVEDMKRLLDGIALDRISVSMTMSGAVLPVLAAFLVAGEESGVPFDRLSGTIQNDILKEYMVRNAWIHAPMPSMRIAGDVVAWLSRHAPRFNGMSISGYHFQEAGAEPALELALTLANGAAYVREMCSRGLDIDTFCARLSFFFGVGKTFFIEIAKLRAARLLWHEIVSSLGGTAARATMLRMHCQTSGWSLSAQQPDNNIVRTTVQAMAAVFGGTQSLHTNAYDEALALPSADAARLARDTQLILQHEMGLCDVVDPWAGSYMMESLTDSMAKTVRDLMRTIENQGGVLAALENGWIGERIHRQALKTQADIDAGRLPVVGMNCFAEGEQDEPVCLEVDGRHVWKSQCERLEKLRKTRDSKAVEYALAALAAGAHDPHANLLALTIDAIRHRATIGECVQALERTWPRYHAMPAYSGQAYREGRDGCEAWATACAEVSELRRILGRAPGFYLGKLGQDGHDRGARSVAAALSDAGFDVTLGPLFETPESMAAQVARGKYDAVGISTLAGAHLGLIPACIAHLRRCGVDIPVVVGGVIPFDHRHQLLEAGGAAVFGPGTAMETIVSVLAAKITAQAREFACATG